MENLFKGISEYLPFSKGVIQRQMSYKIGFFMRTIGGLIQVLIMYYLWMSIFNSSPTGEINGFTAKEMVLYVIISYITSSIVEAYIEGTISSEIRDGSIATYLIKPISYQKRILFESFGQVILKIVTVLLPLWIGFSIYRFVSIGETLPSIGNILLYLVSLVLAFCVRFTFNFIFGLSAFFVTYIWGFMLCKGIIFRFFSGELIPMIFFPLALQNVLKFLPFSALNYTPVMIYMGKFTTNEIIFSIGVQVVWLIIFYVALRLLWKKAIKRLTVLGG